MFGDAIEPSSGVASEQADAGAEDGRDGRGAEGQCPAAPSADELGVRLPPLPRRKTLVGVGSLIGRTGRADELGKQLCAYIRHSMIATQGTSLAAGILAFLGVPDHTSSDAPAPGTGPLQRGKDGTTYRIVSVDAVKTAGPIRSERWGVTLDVEGHQVPPAHRTGQDVVSLSVGKTRGFAGFDHSSLSFEVIVDATQRCSVRVDEEATFAVPSHYSKVGNDGNPAHLEHHNHAHPEHHTCDSQVLLAVVCRLLGLPCWHLGKHSGGEEGHRSR